MTTIKNPPRMFYGNKNDLLKIQGNLKLTQCPHCGQFGTLIFNGTAKGYSEGSDLPITRRRRIVCNARRKINKGCGRSISVFSANVIPHFRVLTRTLLIFAMLIASGISTYRSFKKLRIDFHRRAATRWRIRIMNAVSLWRNKLFQITEPVLVYKKDYKPYKISLLQESLNHFRLAFNKTQNYFSAFELKFFCSVL